MEPVRMLRVSRRNPCPVCGKPDWCLVAPDGSAAICPRIETGAIKRCGDAGWLHILCEKEYKKNRKGNTRRFVHLKQRKRPRDFSNEAQQFQKHLTSEHLQQEAEKLGVSVGSLARLGIGWDGRAFTFPMYDGKGNVIGIRRRFPWGAKSAHVGSINGLFIPKGLSTLGGCKILICEGPTDTAAALDLGYEALGRPSCRAGTPFLAQILRSCDVVIIGDNDPDEAGKKGAQQLARKLVLTCSSVKIVFPPSGIKDLRQWLNCGATREMLEQEIHKAEIFNVRVMVTCS